MSQNQPTPENVSDNLIRLWETLDGRRCTITKEAFGPPFEVAIYFRTHTPLACRTFTTHNEAAQFEIAKMAADRVFPGSAAATQPTPPAPYPG